MTNYEKIIQSLNDNLVVHVMMLNTPKEELIKCNAEEIAEIINTRMDKAPCNYYCNNCGETGVALSHCKTEIVRWLNS